MSGVGRLCGQTRAHPLTGCGVPSSATSWNGWPPLGALAPSGREPCSLHTGLWVRQGSQQHLPGCCLSLGVLAPQPEAEEAPAPGQVPEQTSRREDPAPCGDPAALDAEPLPFPYPAHGGPAAGVGTGGAPGRVTPGSAQGEGLESPSLPQSRASPGPAGASPVGLPWPHIPPLSQDPQTPFPAPFQPLPGNSRPPPTHRIFRPASSPTAYHL